MQNTIYYIILYYIVQFRMQRYLTNHHHFKINKNINEIKYLLYYITNIIFIQYYKVSNTEYYNNSYETIFDALILPSHETTITSR